MAKRKTTNGYVPLSDEELLQQIREAQKRTAIALATESRPTSVHYDRASGAIVVTMANGAFFGFPVDLSPWLANASPEDLALVEITPLKEGLYWPTLDVDLYIPGLIRTLLFTPSWIMQEFGRAGGESRSPAKARAARRNGARGGRPRKVASSRKRSTPLK